jgi:DNA processing protein
MSDPRGSLGEEGAVSTPILDHLRLALTGGIGWRLARRIRFRFGSLRAAFGAREAELMELPGIGPALARRILGKDLEEKAARELENATSAGWRIDSPGDEGYPPLLGEIYDPPLVLYRWGPFPGEDEPGSRGILAMVGSRRATPYGLRQAEKIAGSLASSGWAVASGLARGIDTAAHRGALLAEGATVAVLGTGWDVTYPRENFPLVEEIREAGGSILTEFSGGTPPLRGNFPRRNRIISGISRGVVVIEAARKSGSLITARWALEEGRDVFALPGSVETGRSSGCHRLIRDGASIVQSGRDILEEMGAPALGGDPPAAPTGMGADQAILDILGQTGEMGIDDLCRAADLHPSELAVRLLRLEVAGAIRRYPGQRFGRCPGAA